MNILTDEEIDTIVQKHRGNSYDNLARTIEAAVLKRLAEQDVEPVAYQSTRNGFIAKEDKNPEYNIGLYTEAQLLAAQQRTAEACAKVCEAIADEYQETESRLWPECRSDAQSGASSCEGSIRDGHWREYL